MADEYALCMDSTRACLHYLKARQLPVDRLFDQLGKALVLTQCLFLTFSEVEVRVDGVFVVSRHRDAVFMIIRASTQFRDAVVPRRPTGPKFWKVSNRR